MPRSRDRAVQGREHERTVGIADLGQHPVLAPPREVLHPDPVLRHQHVLPQRLQPPVVGELLAPVVALGGLGQNLHDQRRVEQRVHVPVLEARLPADRHHVGVRVEPGAAHLDAHVADVRLARPPAQLRAQLGEHVPRHQVVCAARPRHGVHAAVHVLAPVLCLSLPDEVLLGGGARLGNRGHATTGKGPRARRDRTQNDRGSACGAPDSRAARQSIDRSERTGHRRESGRSESKLER